MIHHVTGDILLTGAQAIAHGVTPSDPMKQGLALHERYPAMHKDFHHWCNQTHPSPGDAWMWGSADRRRIVNLLTQEGGYGHGRPGRATVSHVRSALKELARLAQRESFRSIALPRLATGVGGLDWDDVWPVVQERERSTHPGVRLHGLRRRPAGAGAWPRLTGQWRGNGLPDLRQQTCRKNASLATADGAMGNGRRKRDAAEVDHARGG